LKLYTLSIKQQSINQSVFIARIKVTTHDFVFWYTTRQIY